VDALAHRIAESGLEVGVAFSPGPLEAVGSWDATPPQGGRRGPHALAADPRSPVLTARAVADTAVLVWSLAITTAIGFAVGFRIHGSVSDRGERMHAGPRSLRSSRGTCRHHSGTRPPGA
jgi:hypothetical protein